jgi:hypothetical protein
LKSNDVPTALLLHSRHGRLRSEKDAVEIGSHHLAEELFGNVFDAAGAPNPGVVDQRIDAAELIEGGLHHLPRDGRLSDIALNRDEIGLVRRRDRPRVSDCAPATLSVCLDERFS